MLWWNFKGVEFIMTQKKSNGYITFGEYEESKREGKMFPFLEDPCEDCPIKQELELLKAKLALHFQAPTNEEIEAIGKGEKNEEM